MAAKTASLASELASVQAKAEAAEKLAAAEGDGAKERAEQLAVVQAAEAAARTEVATIRADAEAAAVEAKARLEKSNALAKKLALEVKDGRAKLEQVVEACVSFLVQTSIS